MNNPFFSCSQWSPVETPERHEMPRSWSMMGWHFLDPSPTLAERATILRACCRDTVQSMGPGPAMCRSALVIKISDRNLVRDGRQQQVSCSRDASHDLWPVFPVQNCDPSYLYLKVSKVHQTSENIWHAFFTSIVWTWEVFGLSQVPSLPGEMEQIKGLEFIPGVELAFGRPLKWVITKSFHWWK